MISVIEWQRHLRNIDVFETVFCNNRVPSLKQDQIIETRIKTKEPL